MFKQLKTIIPVLFFLFLFSFAYALNLNITAVDGGLNQSNLTNNASYEITFLANSSITIAQISLQPIFFRNPYIISSQIIPDGYYINNLSAYGKLTNNNLSFDGDWGTNAQLNMVGSSGTTANVIALMYENYTIPTGTTMANWTYRYSLQSGGSCLASFSIYCINISNSNVLLMTNTSDIGLTTSTVVVDESCLLTTLRMLSEMRIYDGNPTSSCDSDENMDVDYYEGNATFINGNNTLFIFNEEISNNYTLTKNNPNVNVDSAFNISNAFDEDNSSYSIFIVNGSNSPFVAQSFFTENISRYANLNNGTWLSEISIENANTGQFRTEWFVECKNKLTSSWIVLENNSISSNISVDINKNCLTTGDLEMKTTLLAQDLSGRGQTGEVMNISYYEGRVRWYSNTYPQNVTLLLNNTIIFNNIGNLSDPNISIDLNTTFIENFVKYSTKLLFSIRSDQFGIINFFDILFITNKTTSGNINIISPTQISQSVVSGNDYSLDIVLSNTGNSNITINSAETISNFFTPNLNDSVSISCSSTLLNGTNITCSLTFTNVQSSAEIDEVVRISGINQDDTSIVVSNSIDVDITVTQSTPTTGGSSGGSVTPLPSETLFDIVIPGTDAQNSGQILIRPGEIREYCLEVKNTGSVTQTISLQCEAVDGQEINACSWVTFDKRTLTVLPSIQESQQFCISIDVPESVEIDQQFEIQIKGTAVSPSSVSGTQDYHKIGLLAQSFSIDFGVLQEPTIWDGFTEAMKSIGIPKNILYDWHIPNLLNPFIILGLFLTPFLIGLLFTDISGWAYLLGEIAYGVIAIWSMSDPMILLIAYSGSTVLILLKQFISLFFLKKA